MIRSQGSVSKVLRHRRKNQHTQNIAQNAMTMIGNVGPESSLNEVQQHVQQQVEEKVQQNLDQLQQNPDQLALKQPLKQPLQQTLQQTLQQAQQPIAVGGGGNNIIKKN